MTDMPLDEQNQENNDQNADFGLPDPIPTASLTTSKKDDKQKEIVRVSVSEAARLFGVTPQTIRRAIANQEITYAVVAGRYKINFESLVRWSQKRTTIRNRLNQHGIGQFVSKWKIKNPLYSPNPKIIAPEETKSQEI